MDMLTFSKERQPEKVPADLNAVVSDVIELMSARAADASVRLEWLPAPGLPQLSFDPEALHRAILNVVTNAIDACEGVPEGRVQVTTEYLAEPQLARVLVGDNGEGISPEDVRKIFTVFESSKGSRGTGLGLPVSLKILQEHGGDIHVESTPNQGSTFRLEFPAPAVNASADGDTGSRPVPPVEPGADPLETTQM
jgi:signal transduction histidine kinase